MSYDNDASKEYLYVFENNAIRITSLRDQTKPMITKSSQNIPKRSWKHLPKETRRRPKGTPQRKGQNWHMETPLHGLVEAPLWGPPRLIGGTCNGASSGQGDFLRGASEQSFEWSDMTVLIRSKINISTWVIQSTPP